jgi:hypothetical protein
MSKRSQVTWGKVQRETRAREKRAAKERDHRTAEEKRVDREARRVAAGDRSADVKDRTRPVVDD